MSEPISIDVIIYTPLPEEYEATQREFIPVEPVTGDRLLGYTGSHDDGYSYLVITGDDFGNRAAQDVWREALQKYTTKLAISVGIGGALTDDAGLGDVYFAKSVVDLTQRAKEAVDNDGVNRTNYDGVHLPHSKEISTLLYRHRLAFHEDSPYRKWQSARDLINRGALVGTDLKNFQRPGRELSKPIAIEGKLASTNAVIASREARKSIKKAGRKLQCVDNESAGFLCELERYPDIKTLIVRGISDFADEGKAELEERHEEIFRKLAVNNAVSFVKDVLPMLLESTEPWPEDLETKSLSPLEQLQFSLEENTSSIGKELHKRSIMHKLTDDLDVIPVPRIRFTQASEDTEKKNVRVVAEISDALGKHARIFVDVPLNYADSAVPWHYASALSGTTLDDRLAIPVIVKWEDFSPPSRGLNRLLENMNLDGLINHADYQFIFVFPDFRMESKPKSEFLHACLEGIENASILIFSHEKRFVTYGDAVTEILQTERATVQAISYSSIISFMNEAHQMTVLDAEVSAKRLMSAFRGHRLPIHPSYLASLSKDALARLINANRRGELVELTVAGLLSMLVADDNADIVISRTGREEFLSKLAVEIYAQKRQFTRENLIKYVTELDKKHNLGLAPASFIAAFETAGVLQFVDGIADIHIPIIRSYMLAKGLIHDDASALIYFDLDEDNFDFSTFDLYCEYSRTHPIKEQLTARLKASIEFFSQKVSEYERPVIDGAYPAMLFDRGMNLTQMASELSEDAEALTSKTSLVNEKQALMDMQDHIAHTDTAKRSSLADRKVFEREYASMRSFYAAAILLGTGVERLTGSEKAEMIELILSLADKMLTDILSHRATFSVDDAINDVSSALIKEHDIKFETEEERTKFEDFVSFGVSMWEYHNAIDPVILIAEILCEAGRTKLLLAPLKEADTSTSLEQFFLTSWGFDVDPVALKKWPRELSKKMGLAKFMRLAFATFFYHRSYWFHSDEGERKVIAEGVNEVLERLSMSQDVAGTPEDESS